jgi:hypothetical protein
MLHENETTNLQEVAKTIRTLHKPGALIELCAIGDEGIVSGLYDDHDALAWKAKQLSDSGTYQGVYITVNPVKSSVPRQKMRAKNRLYHNIAARTRDQDIERRSWLVLDFDPVRKAKTSATSRQKGAALWCMAQTTGTLRREFGLPEPVTADSGNGYYACYAVDLPNDEEIKALFKQVTKAIAAKFSIQAQLEGELVRVVEIDDVTFNASRLVKLFGTVAQKGPHTALTPHRVSRLAHVPAKVPVVTRKQLEDLAGLFGAKKMDGANGARITAAMVEKFLGWAEIGVKGVSDEADGSRKWIIDDCPFDPTHTNSPAVFLREDGTLGYHCFHKSCEDYGGKEFQDVVERGKGKKFSFAASADYWESEDGIFWRTSGRRGVEADKKLSNFNAHIIADIREDDGVNCRHEMKIEATVKGRRSTLIIPASEFKSMNWVLDQLGSEAVIYPGPGTADHGEPPFSCFLETLIVSAYTYTPAGAKSMANGVICTEVVRLVRMDSRRRSALNCRLHLSHFDCQRLPPGVS